MRTTMITQLVTSAALVGVLCLTTSAAAQVPGLEPAPTPPAELGDVRPAVRLTYYVGGDGITVKEVRYIDLSEWAADKDVYIEFKWSEAPLADRLYDSRKEHRYSRELRSHSWQVRYTPAEVEGQSRLFVVGLGKQAKARIYNADDLVTFLYVRPTGWYEMGGLARFSRYIQRQQPYVQPPLPTRTQ